MACKKAIMSYLWFSISSKTLTKFAFGKVRVRMLKKIGY